MRSLACLPFDPFFSFFTWCRGVAWKDTSFRSFEPFHAYVLFLAWNRQLQWTCQREWASNTFALTTVAISHGEWLECFRTRLAPRLPQKTFSDPIPYLAGREKGIANWRGQQGLQWYLRTTVLGDNGTRNCSGLDSKVHVHFFPNTRVVRLARCLWGFDVFTRRFNVCDFAFCFFPFFLSFFWSRLFS